MYSIVVIKMVLNGLSLCACCEVQSSVLSAKLNIITEPKRELTTKLAIAQNCCFVLERFPLFKNQLFIFQETFSK